MDGSGIISGLANIVSGNVSGAKQVPSAQNQTTSLQQFAADTILRGTVVSRGINKAVTIQTNQGNVTIQTDVFLKRGAEVALKIEQRASEAMARIISVNGQSLAKYLESGQAQGEQDTVATSSKLLNANKTSPTATPTTTATQELQGSTVGTTFRGVFLAPPQIPLAVASQLPPALAQALMQAGTGTSLQLNIQSIQVPSATGEGLQALAGSSAEPTPQSTASVSTTSPSSGYALSAAQKIAATTPHIQTALANQQATQTPLTGNETISTTPPHSPAAATSQTSISGTPQPSTILNATVINNTNPRELTLQSDLGSFKLFVTTSLPKGSVIQFMLHHVADVRTGQTLSVDSTTLRFNAMESIQSMTHYPPNELVPSPPHIVPRAGAQLSSEMVFLMAALKGGDMRKWLGDDNIKQLELQGKSSMLSRIQDEFSQLKSPPSEPRDGNWQHFMLPVASEKDVHATHFFVKGETHESEDGSTHDTDHFMVDLELTRMGRLQLDGLLQKHANYTQFDLIVRTERPWDDININDIRQIYMRAQEISGFSGGISFKTDIMPLPIDISEHPASNGRSIIA